MKKTSFFILVLVLLGTMGVTGLAWAQGTVIQPKPAQPKPYTPLTGDKLKPPPPPPKKVFVTSQTFTGNFGGLPGAEWICKYAALDAGLTGTFKPWLSAYRTVSEVTGPLQTFTRSSGPYIRVDGVVIADNFNAFITFPYALKTSISVTERGYFAGISDDFLVWTGIMPGYVIATGQRLLTYQVGCNNWVADGPQCPPTAINQSGSTLPCYGIVGNLTKYWSEEWTRENQQALPGGSQYCNKTAHLYCFEQ